MSFLQHGLSEDSTGYTVNQSLRLRASNSAYLSRTFGTPTNNTVWTFSAWLKRGKLGSQQCIFGASQQSVEFLAGDTISFFSAGNPVATSTAVFRDPSAHMHLHVVSNGSTVKANINNAEVLSYTGTLPSINSAIVHMIGRYANAATDYADIYLSEPVFVDGQALVASYFGQTDPTTGIWVPKKYTGTYGTNGFYLPFNDATSLTTLGYDRSGNGNNWTCNGISITAGATYDVMKDSPTNGAGEVGNYCTWNPLSNSTPASLSEANLKFANVGAVRTNSTLVTPISGKFYIELTNISVWNSSYGMGFGVSNQSVGISTTYNASNSYLIYMAAIAQIINNGTATGTVSSIVNLANQVFQLCVDVDNSKIWIGQNNVWFNSTGGTNGNPSTNSNPTFSISCAELNIFAYVNSSASVGWQANFGQRPFAYTPPTGFKALHTGNLPDATPVTTSGTFTGNASTDGPCIFINGTPTAMTINSNAVTFATHADKLAGGFKVRSSSASYNTAGTNTYSITTNSGKFKNARAQANP